MLQFRNFNILHMNQTVSTVLHNWSEYKLMNINKHLSIGVLMSIMLVLLSLRAIPVYADELPRFSQGDDDMSGLEGDPNLIAPEFPSEGIEWINVPAPLSLESLRGKIVILDFWTYGCINCIHMIPVLRELEETYPDELVVIGVHSAKFDNEGETENLEEIVQRYEITHPVINDSDFIVWQQYRVQAWPTFAVINPLGRLLAFQSGEIPLEPFDQLVGDMVTYFDGIGELNRDPIELSLEGDGNPNTLLRYPGKVLADVENNRLFIADSSHHRIVVADLTTYEVLYTIGSGQRGFQDGDFASARFNAPQGMAIHDEILYIADTNNHAIRVIDLTEQTVDILAGTGEIGGGISNFSTQITEPRAFTLRSPWDVTMGDNATMYIAMAGTHQIWEIDLETNVLRPSVGNGREALLNGELSSSELAQPSGLYWDNGLLYFADSESSTVRVADYPNNMVTTISGTLENNLFQYGDVDGVVGISRLQHPLGVTGDGDGLIYITDTYNSRIKQVDQTMTTTTLFGLDNDGFADGGMDVAQFDEPGGLDYAEFGGRHLLFVADTNNHMIRVIDLETNMVSTVTFPNPEALQIADAVTIVGGNSGDTIRLPEQTVSAGDGGINLRLMIPDGYKLNDLSESRVAWSTEGTVINISADNQTTTIDSPEMTIPIVLSEGEALLTGELTLYWCEDENESLCFIEEVTFEVPISVVIEGDFESVIIIAHELTPPIMPDGGIG